MNCSVCDGPVYCRGWCNKHYRRWKKYGDPESGVYRFKGATLEESFRWHMPGSPPEDDRCWEWRSSRDAQGYGQIGVGKQVPRAHVVAYRLFVGLVSDGEIVRHTCDNPPCVNPRHLLTGTHQDNTNDKMERGRQTKGQEVPWTRLTDSDVITIRSLHARGETQLFLANTYGVSRSRISEIVRHKTWKHLPPCAGTSLSTWQQVRSYKG